MGRSALLEQSMSAILQEKVTELKDESADQGTD